MRHKTPNTQAGTKWQPPGYRFASACYEHFQLIYVSSGRITLKTKSDTIEASPGSILFLGFGCDFSLFTEKQEYTGVYFSAFDSSILDAWKHRTTAFRAPADLRLIAELMEHQLNNPTPAGHEILINLGRALALGAADVLDQQSSRLTPINPPQYWADCVRSALEAGAFTARGIEATLGALPLSTRQLTRHFQTIYGLSPKQYQQQLRLDQAMRLLRQTDQPITTIAYELGYSSSQHFATQFAHATGLSPRDYRRG